MLHLAAQMCKQFNNLCKLVQHWLWYRLNEMKAALNSKLLYGDESGLDAEVNQVLVASEGINELLAHLEKMDARPLIITSRDRTDVLWTLLTAHSNPLGPRIAGILLTSEGTGPT